MGRIQTGKRKGQWTPEEDEKLTTYIKKHGEGNWQALPKPAGLNRSWKSCRLRWMNYLRPDIKRGNFSPEEEELIVQLHSLLGDKWSLIAGRLPGRTDNQIKKFWHIHLKKKLIQAGIDPVTHQKFSQGRTDNNEIKSFNSLGERKGFPSHQPIQGELQTFEDDSLHLSNFPTDQKLYSDSTHNLFSTEHHDASVHAAAAVRIQNKFLSWKGRKDFLIIRQQIVKIQAHVRGHQVRKNYKKIVQSLGILEKFIWRWRRTGSSLHGLKSEELSRGGFNTLDASSKEDDFDFLKEGRKQKEEMLQKAPARVKSVVQNPEARTHYHRLLNIVNEIQGTKLWKEILEDCAPGVESQHFHPPFSSTQPDTLGNIPKQAPETLGELSTNSFGEWKEFVLNLPIHGEELQGTTSTQFADVASESLMDYTNEFSEDEIFKGKEELIEYTREIGRKKGFVIVTKRSDSGNGAQRARITFCCERGGRYRNTGKDKGEKEETTNTKKCACPFELKGYKLNKLSSDDNWMLKVKCGVHNHPITEPREGRSCMGSLTKKERLLVEDMFKSKICTKDILNTLKNRDVNNVSRRKHIYNARQKFRVKERHKVKEMGVSSNNPLNSNSFNNFFPAGLQRYIDHCKDVEADGNCGFRAISDLVGFGENEWLRVRKDLLTELKSNLQDYRRLYGSDERVKELIEALSNIESHPSLDGWMTMPDMGHLIASAYNVVLFHLSMQQCLTFLPLRSVPVPTDSHKEIAIGFVNNNHFVEVFLLPGHPVPPIATSWYKFRHSCAKEWENVYISHIQRFKEIIGNNVATNEIIDIDNNSFYDEPDELVHAAATRIQNKFRSWKGRKDFLTIRQQIVKIQAYVRGHGVRCYYKEKSGRILDKDMLHWRQKGSCSANSCSPSSSHTFSQGSMSIEQQPIHLIERIDRLITRVRQIQSRIQSLINPQQQKEQTALLSKRSSVQRQSQIINSLSPKVIPMKHVNAQPKPTKLYRGVRPGNSGKWLAEITLPWNRRTRCPLGTFNTAEEAALAYDRAAYRLRRESASLSCCEETEKEPVFTQSGGNMKLDNYESESEYSDSEVENNSSSSSSSSSSSDYSSVPLASAERFSFVLDCFFPVGLKPYICDIKDVTDDGNSGFRVIADLMGYDEDGWLQVRKDLLNELNSNLEHYSLLYGTDGSNDRVKELIHALSYFESCPNYDQGMIMPDMGHLIASTYDVVLFHISLPRCLTFLPLRSVPIPTDSRKHIAIGSTDKNHFVEVFLSPDHPVPPISPSWYKFHRSCAKEWKTMYISRMEHFNRIIGFGVAMNEMIDIGIRDDIDSEMIDSDDIFYCDDSLDFNFF